MKKRINVLLAAAMMTAGASSAFAAGDHGQHQAASNNASASTAGEVRKVDLEQGKVTLKHEAITNLDMPPMTMVFRAEKPELLKNLNVGDKVRFTAAAVGGAIVVTHIQPNN